MLLWSLTKDDYCLNKHFKASMTVWFLDSKTYVTLMDKTLIANLSIYLFNVSAEGCDGTLSSNGNTSGEMCCYTKQKKFFCSSTPVSGGRVFVVLA